MSQKFKKRRKSINLLYNKKKNKIPNQVRNFLGDSTNRKLKEIKKLKKHPKNQNPKKMSI